MKRAGIRNVHGGVFTEQNKEVMVTALKESIRHASCRGCGWNAYIESLEADWRTTCSEGCISLLGNPQKSVSQLHKLYDP